MSDPRQWQTGEAEESRRLRFGLFELDLRNCELWRRGAKVKVQLKPFQILCRLVQTPGELVTRKELAQHLWPHLHVDFEGSLNTAVNALRRVLRDPWRNPRFIETRPGIGYRFIATVQTMDENGAGNSAAYPDYRKGRYFQSKLTEEDLRKSAVYFQSALAADLEYAPAYAGLADTYTLFAAFGLMPAAEALNQAGDFADSALRIDRRSAEAHSALADIRKLRDWDFVNAESEYRHAVELNANSSRAHQSYAAFLSSMGRQEEARRSIQRAMELDPTSLVASADAAWILYMSRDFQAAAEQSWKTLAMDPRFAPAQNTLGLAYAQMGMTEEAIVEFQNACVCSDGHPSAKAALGHTLAIAGRQEEARAILRELEHLAQHRLISPYWMSVLHAGLGDGARALELLRQADRDRDVWLIWISVEPRFDPLRGRPEFDELAARVQCPGVAEIDG